MIRRTTRTMLGRANGLHRPATTLAAAVSVALAGSGQALAQEDTDEAAAPAPPSYEEVVITARQRSSAEDVVLERIEMDVVSDLLDAEAISRVGDSTVSLALRRVPGLTLVNDQFVYVRGLGERYSSAALNGAQVPSPDLTRNVIPLDIFPTQIIDSLAVQKGYSPDMPAAFGGGNVNIRTKGIPNGLVASFEIGTAWNTESSDDGFTYPGGGDDEFGSDDGTRALPGDINDAITLYRGDISPTGIFQSLLQDGGAPAFAEAEAINRNLATALYRDIDFSDKSLSPDLTLEGALGNRWQLGDDWEFGAIALANYDNKWRNRKRINRSVLDPENEFSETERTINQVTLTGVVNLGLNYGDDHELTTTSMFLRDTEDEASLKTGFNFNFIQADGQQFRNYDIRYEERVFRANQIRGNHVVGDDTRALVPFLDRPMFDGVEVDWYYSDAVAETDIPSEIRVSAEDTVDPATGAVLATAVRTSGSAAEYRYTDLEDQVESYGWDVMKPIEFGDHYLELSGGWDYSRKARDYVQTQLSLGTTSGNATDLLVGTPGDVFTDAIITDPDNGFILSIGGIGTESYLAAQTVEGAYGKFDLSWGESWRFAGGLRWEQFQQASLPFDPLEYDVTVGQVAIPDDQLDQVVFQEDEIYPALSATYLLDDFWAEKFQLRFGWSETVARPDLREISEATFIDPLTEARVRGEAGLQTSAITNLDVRAEWFFDSGDNFTVSAFYKDIDDPIETIEGDGTDDNISLTFINAESAEVYGLEVEWLKSLAFLSDRVGQWADGFFLSGNLTLSDSEITVGDAALDLTNNTRRMSQHSEYVANVQLGYDSPEGGHAVSLVYNTFGERLFFAGKNGAEDAFEQPLNTLDLVYTWFPTNRLSMKFRLQNILNDDIEIEQAGVTTFEQEFGTTAKLDLKWSF